MKRNERVRDYSSEGRKIKKEKETSEMSREKKRQTDRQEKEEEENCDMVAIPRMTSADLQV